MQDLASLGWNDISHDDQGQARVGRRRIAGFLFDVKEASAGVESQGISQRLPFACNETKTTKMAGSMSPPSPPQDHAPRLCRQRPPFVRIRCTSCSSSNLAVLGSLPVYVLEEEDKGDYK